MMAPAPAPRAPPARAPFSRPLSGPDAQAVSSVASASVAANRIRMWISSVPSRNTRNAVCVAPSRKTSKDRVFSRRTGSTQTQPAPETSEEALGACGPHGLFTRGRPSDLGELLQIAEVLHHRREVVAADREIEVLTRAERRCSHADDLSPAIEHGSAAASTRDRRRDLQHSYAVELALAADDTFGEGPFEILRVADDENAIADRHTRAISER